MAEPYKVRVVQDDLINFGEVPQEVNEILQRGVALYRHDRDGADLAFRQALALAPDCLPSYLCLYKIHTYQGNLDAALEIAVAGLDEAARQACLNADWQMWKAEQFSEDVNSPGHFALYTLKALAFIHLRRDEAEMSRRLLAKLEDLGAMEKVGGTVIAALADGSAGA